MPGSSRLDFEDLEGLAEPLLHILDNDRRKAAAIAAEVSMQFRRWPAFNADEELLFRCGALGLGRVVGSPLAPPFGMDERNVTDLVQRNVHLLHGGFA